MFDHLHPEIKYLWGEFAGFQTKINDNSTVNKKDDTSYFVQNPEIDCTSPFTKR